MKIVGLFNRMEEKVGFRLAGIDSKLVKSKEELNTIIDRLKTKKDIGILIISKTIYEFDVSLFKKIEENKYPLLQIIDNFIEN